MKKQVLTEEINRVLELMKVDKKIISEATVAPGGLLARLLGDAVDFVASKIGAEAFESLEAKFASSIERIGRTFENVTEKEIGTILKSVEYAGLRKAAGESIAQKQQQLIDGIIAKYAIEVGGKKSLTVDGGKAVTKELVEAGIYRPFIQDIKASWKANGGWSRLEGKAVDNAADDAAKLAADDLARKAEQEAAELALRKLEEEARKAAEKLEKLFLDALNIVKKKPEFKDSYNKFEEIILAELQVKKKDMLDIVRTNPTPVQAIKTVDNEMARIVADLPTVEKGGWSKLWVGYKNLWKPKYEKIPFSNDIKLKGWSTLGGWIGGVTLSYGTLFLINGVIGMIGILIKKLKDPKVDLNTALVYAWTHACYNILLGTVEGVTGDVDSDKLLKDRQAKSDSTKTNTPPAPVAGAKYANNIDGFKQYCKDEGIDATNAISLSGSIYKTNTTSGIEYKFKELDATSKLGTFE
jgi:hypothetical protein